ncbi:MAG TPA: SLC13 family permease, partial [Planctomycetota bacterium]|nr:SLC13 family permease [Planctomycetota bacterium]
MQFAGLLAGPLLAWLAYSLLPTSYLGSAGEALPFSEAGRATLAVMVWMATWWMTEAIDLTATALLPLVVFPLFGIASMTVASASYAHPLVFLFMGGFLLALSMRRWGLDRRLALITLRMVGSKPTNMVGGFMLVSAVLSAFVSNTATVAMMLPIGMSVVALASKGRATEGCEPTEDPGRSFATCLMLGIAYASSIGGLATIIGTPPNVFLVGFLRNSISEPFRTEVGFAQWMLIGVPLAVVFLPITWWLLTRVLFPVRMPTLKGSREWIEAEYTALGPLNRGEKWTLIVFSLTALAWVLRPLLVGVEWSMDGHLVRPLAGLTDPGIAMTGALTLFVLPVSRRPLEFVMHWGAARELPWGIL